MQNIFNDVKVLMLPLGEYVIVGGAALSGRGIRDYNDIDLMLTERLYEKLKEEGWEEREKGKGFYHIYKGKVEAAKDFTHIKGCTLTTKGVITNAEIIEGVPFMSLDDLVTLKKTMAREKDFKDIETIEKYLRSKG